MLLPPGVLLPAGAVCNLIESGTMNVLVLGLFLLSPAFAGVIVKGHGFGLVGNIIVGIVGAFIAGWLLPNLGLGLTGIVGSIVYALIGAVILLVIIGFIKRAT